MMYYKSILFFLLTLATTDVSAQLNRIRLSPLQKTEVQVGLTNITLEYSRPSMKDRTIFGGLVPYDEMWRTGANRNSKISFSTDVTIGDGVLKAGTYAIFSKPGKETWDIYFYTETSYWDVPDDFDIMKVATQIRVKSTSTGRDLESLEININDITESSLALTIAWENTSVSIPISLHTHERMTELMDKQLDRNAVDFHIAAAYLQERNIELPKAKKLMEKAIVLNDGGSVWDHLVMSWIHDQMGNREEAIKSSKLSLEMAKKQGSESGIEENTANLKKWGVL